jgi:dienelactone hydrolase
MRVENIEYQLNGTTHIGTLAVDDRSADRRPAVLVCHEGPGISDVTRDKAKRLAEAGYVAFALDYHGGGKVLDGMPAVMARLGPLMQDPDATRALGRAGLNVLLAQPETDPSKVAAIGYCFGGTMVLELARGGEDLKAVVGFHSGLATARPEDAKNVKGKVLVCIGTEDPLIPADQRSAFEHEMRAAGVDWRMNLYGGAAHSFTNPHAASVGIPGIEYHEPTDVRSWAAMIDLFDEVFGAR